MTRLCLSWPSANPSAIQEPTLSTQPDNSLAPATDPDGKPVKDEAVEINPVTMWDKLTLPGNDADLYDFTPRPEDEVEEEVDDPKDSRAAGSALAEIYETVKTPLVDWSGSQEPPASVEKDNGQDKGSETGQQISSSNPPTTDGSSGAPV